MEQNITPQPESNSAHPSAARILILEEKVAKLKVICDQLDPYQPIPQNLVEKLGELEIVDLYNPFHVTNKLLMLLEDSIEELHSLQA
jgi:hypothetical protein